MTPTLPVVRFIGRWAGPLLLLLTLFCVFTDLGGLVLRQWDESRQAVSAIEMSQSGNWVVATFGFEPDLWNTKPPLLVWLQAGLIRLIGPTEWAIRLPSAVAALATVMLVYSFMAKHLRRPLGGFLVGFGTRYAGGCTSGHAISGLANLQWVSLVAVIGFFAGGLLMTWVIYPLLF